MKGNWVCCLSLPENSAFRAVDHIEKHRKFIKGGHAGLGYLVANSVTQLLSTPHALL